MALSGVKKAALLLTALDSATAVQLLKSASPDLLAQIAAEMAALDQGGAAATEAHKSIREFFGLMAGGRKGRKDFVKELLDNTVGKDKSGEMLSRVQDLVEAKDPFLPIRSAGVEDIASALSGESPQVAALVLGELPPRKSAQLLPLLDEKVRNAAIQGMTDGLTVAADAKLKVARIIRTRLDAMAVKGVTSGEGVKRQQQLRKVAVLLRGLDAAFRDGLLKSVAAQDSATADAVRKLMVIWEDVPAIADRGLQNVLRSVDSRKLALALVKADEVTSRKIRTNISERAVAMLDEETGLLSHPKTEEVEQAREAILDSLRELNSRGELPLEGAA